MGKKITEFTLANSVPTNAKFLFEDVDGTVDGNPGDYYQVDESNLPGGVGGGDTLPVADTTSIVKGSIDPTKLLRFEVDGFTTSSTRSVTPPDADGTMVLEAFAQSLTNKTIDGDNNTLSNLDIGLEVDWALAADVSDRIAFASGDKLLIFEAGVGLRKIDFDDLPAGGGGGTLDGLTDVTITTPATGATLIKSAGDWVDGQLDLANADAVTGDLPLTNIAQIGTDTFLGRVTAATGDIEVLSNAQAKTALDLAGSNTGDQASIVGLTGTKAQFNTELSDGSFMFVGDAPTAHTHLLAAGATDVTATFGELNLLDLAGLTAGWVLSADTATTASWKAPSGGGSPTFGTDNQIPVMNAAGDDFEYDADFIYDPSTNQLTMQQGSSSIVMGATSDSYKGVTYRQIIKGNSGDEMILADSGGSGTGSGGKLSLAIDDGALPANNDRLGEIKFLGYRTSSQWGLGASIIVDAEANWGTFDFSSRMEFHVDFAGTEIVPLVIKSTGDIELGNATTGQSLFQGDRASAAADKTDFGQWWVRTDGAPMFTADDGVDHVLNAAAGGAPFVDTTSIVEGSVDDTKELRFEVDGFTTGTVRVATWPDQDGTVMYADTTDVLTNKTIDGNNNTLTVLGASQISGDIPFTNLAQIGTDTFLGRITAATGDIEVLTNAQAKTALDLTGTNSGDQSSMSGISDTKANFNTALSDGTFMYIGDAPTAHTHLLAAGATDVTATFGELNLLDLAGLTAGWVLSADTATTASWKAPSGGASALNDLSDVTLTTPATGAVLIKSAGDWIDGQVDLADADAVTGNLPDGNIASAGTWNALVSNATHTGDVAGDTALTIGANKVLLSMMAQIATDSFLGRITAATGNVEVLTNANAKTMLDLTGTNSGDQTTMAGISDTKTDFNTALSDGTFMYVGDAPTAHTHPLADGATDVTATAGEVNLLDLAGLTVGWVLSADSATTASWKAPSGGSSAPFVDTTSIVEGSVDGTKELRFEVDGFTTATVRVLTPPDSDGTLVLEAFAQALTNKTINADSNTISGIDFGLEAEWAAIGDVSDRTAFTSGDKILIFEAGVGMRKVDFDDLPGAGGGITSLNAQTSSVQTFANDTNVTMVSSGGNLHTITWSGTLADGRIASAATWSAKQDALTFGIADGNAVDIDAGATIVALDYAKWTTTGLIGQTYSEVRTDLNVADGANNYSHPDHTGDVASTGDGATVIGTNKVLLAMMAQVATDTFLGRVTAATGNVEVLTNAQAKTALDLTGTNSGDQTTIVGITGTKGQFDTAVTDGDFMYVGDAPTAHTHLLAAGATDVTATFGELNLLDLAGLTAGWVLSADTATTASWKAPTGGASAPFVDTTSIVEGSADNTKELRFEVDGFTTGTVRVLTPPNADGTIVLEDFAQPLLAKTELALNAASATYKTVAYDLLNVGGDGISSLIDTAASGTGGGYNLSVGTDDGAAMGSGHRLGSFMFSAAYDASNLYTGADIEAFATELWSATQRGTRLEFQGTADGATTRSTFATMSATQIALGNFVFNMDQTVGVGQDNFVLTYDDGTGEIGLEVATGGGGGMVTGISKNSGANVNAANRSVLNFIEGANITLTIADDAGGDEVDITIAASGGGGSFGSDNEIPFTNVGGTDFDYDSTFTFDGSHFALGTSGDTLSIGEPNNSYDGRTFTFMARGSVHDTAALILGDDEASAQLWLGHMDGFPIINNDEVGTIQFVGPDGTGTESLGRGSSIRGVAMETWGSGGPWGCELEFFVIQSGTNTNRRALTIDNDGYMWNGNSSGGAYPGTLYLKEGGVEIGSGVAGWGQLWVESSAPNKLRFTNDASDTWDLIGANTGTANPSTTPVIEGEIFVDTTGDNVWMAKGTASSADWVQVNGAVGGGAFTIERDFVAAVTVALGDLCHLNSSGEMVLADADAESTANRLLGIALEAITSTNTGAFLLMGEYVETSAFSTGMIGWVSATAGAIATTAPAGANDIARIVGYGLDANTLWFAPDPTYVVR